MLTAGDNVSEVTAVDGTAGITNASSTIRMTDFIGSKASVRIWLFIIAIISAAMCGLILYMPGLKMEESAEKIYL